MSLLQLILKIKKKSHIFYSSNVHYFPQSISFIPTVSPLSLVYNFLLTPAIYLLNLIQFILILSLKNLKDFTISRLSKNPIVIKSY